MAPCLSRVLVGALFSQTSATVTQTALGGKQVLTVHCLLLRAPTWRRRRLALYSTAKDSVNATLPTSRLNLLGSRTVYKTARMNSNNPLPFSIPFPLQLPIELAESHPSHGRDSALPATSSTTRFYPYASIPGSLPVASWFPSSTELSSMCDPIPTPPGCSSCVSFDQPLLVSVY